MFADRRMNSRCSDIRYAGRIGSKRYMIFPGMTPRMVVATYCRMRAANPETRMMEQIALPEDENFESSDMNDAAPTLDPNLLDSFPLSFISC